MNVLIIGKNSFVGKIFVKNYSTRLNIKEVCTIENKPDKINFTDIDVVIHLAAIVHQTKSISDEIYFSVNRDLAYEVAKKAKSAGVKQFVFMSTAKVFGESTTNIPAWNEHSECNPFDAYGKSKLEAEKLLISLEDETFKVAIIRSPLVYGAGVKANMFIFIKLIDKLPILPLGNINNKRSFVFVGNLVALINHIIGNQNSGIFIAGDQQSLSVTELGKLIENHLQKKRYFITIPKFGLTILKKIKPTIFERLYGSLELDNSTTNKKLNFIPPVSTQDGIKEMVNWYLESR